VPGLGGSKVISMRSAERKDQCRKHYRWTVKDQDLELGGSFCFFEDDDEW